MAEQVKSRLYDFYQQECIPRMMQEFRYKSPMQVPKLKKIVLNLGLGEAIQNIKLLESASTELAAITAARPEALTAGFGVLMFWETAEEPAAAVITVASGLLVYLVARRGRRAAST